MQTPIADFVKNYSEGNKIRFHMPGHKGQSFLGCEKFDITEIKGADSLYEAKGIIAESERNAAELFSTKATFYATEGSSQCIRAMLHLALSRDGNTSRTILAARNVHKAFVYAAALLDFNVEWLFPETPAPSLCSCPISVELLEIALGSMQTPPAAVYITSPNYLGNIADIKALSEVTHRYGTILLVDNAHGAYLHFLENSLHPMDLGADLCCDSAHKTLPVLTGGAYLHIGKNASQSFEENAREALSLFGSTSPSYLTLMSLDLCNRYLDEGYRERLSGFMNDISDLKESLKQNGWEVCESDPLRLTIKAPQGLSGTELLEKLSEKDIECEYADPDHLVMMFTPENDGACFEKILDVLGVNTAPQKELTHLPFTLPKCAISIREAVMSKKTTVTISDSIGKICASPTVSCPPAIPIAVSGEVISRELAGIFTYYGIDTVDIVKE